MRRLIYSILIMSFCHVGLHAQVGIETDNVSNKAILDFPDNADGGILLPYVSNPSSDGLVPGTMIYNANTGIIEYRDKNNAWIGMTPTPKDNNNIVTHDTNTFNELDADGVSISNTDAETTAKGVLVLESNNRALALPKVDNVENIASPTTGMICYDKSRRALAIYNGERWILRN